MSTGRNYDAWSIRPIDPNAASREELLAHLVGWGILAPSTHNVQPSRFVIDPEERRVDVCVDGAFVLPASDRTGRQAVVSAGCAIQNIAYAAAYYGLECVVEPFDTAAWYPSPIATLRFSGNGSVHEERLAFLDAMRSRRMNRSEYAPERSIPESVVDIARAAAEEGKVSLHAITDRAAILAIANLFQYPADKWVIFDQRFRNELEPFFLENDSEEGRGMPGSTFGLDDATSRDVKSELGKAGRVNAGTMAGFSKAGRDGLRSAPAVFVIAVPDDGPRWWLAAGMAFQKIAVAAEMNGLAIAVHAATVEVKLQNQLLKAMLKASGRPTMLFRMGYPTRPMPHAPRVAAADVIETRK